MEILLTSISKLIELMLSLAKYRSKQRKYLFEEVLDPSFYLLLDIHKNYVDLFRQAIDTLPSSNDLESDQFVKQLDKAKQVITKGRSEYEAERVLIRQNAKSFFGAELHKEEKRFLWAIICYFIRPEIRLKDYMIDMDVKLLEELGPHDAIDSPSLAVAGRIASKTDPCEIRKDLEQGLFNQLDRWTDVCRLYSELRLAVVTKT